MISMTSCIVGMKIRAMGPGPLELFSFVVLAILMAMAGVLVSICSLHGLVMLVIATLLFYLLNFCSLCLSLFFFFFFFFFCASGKLFFVILAFPVLFQFTMFTLFGHLNSLPYLF